jgi:hypothetical protein
MADKRFQTLLLDFDKIEDQLTIRSDFFIDGKPIDISSELTSLESEEAPVYKPLEISLNLTKKSPLVVSPLLQVHEDNAEKQDYANVFLVNNIPKLSKGRATVIINVYGLGRTAELLLRIDSIGSFRLKGIHWLYNEKSINKRRN